MDYTTKHGDTNREFRNIRMALSSQEQQARDWAYLATKVGPIVTQRLVTLKTETQRGRYSYDGGNTWQDEPRAA